MGLRFGLIVGATFLVMLAFVNVDVLAVGAHDRTSITGGGTLTGCGTELDVSGEAVMISESEGFYAAAAGDRDAGFHYTSKPNGVSYGMLYCNNAAETVQSFQLQPYAFTDLYFVVVASGQSLTLSFVMGVGTTSNPSGQTNVDGPTNEAMWRSLECGECTEIIDITEDEGGSGSTTLCDPWNPAFCVTAIVNAEVICGVDVSYKWCKAVALGGVHVVYALFQEDQHLEGHWWANGCSDTTKHGCQPWTAGVDDFGECYEDDARGSDSCEDKSSWTESERGCWWCQKERLFLHVYDLADGAAYSDIGTTVLLGDVSVTSDDWMYNTS